MVWLLPNNGLIAPKCGVIAPKCGLIAPKCWFLSPRPKKTKEVTLQIWEESDNLGGFKKKWEDFYVFDNTLPIKK
jgi:hypothetical protein